MPNILRGGLLISLVTAVLTVAGPVQATSTSWIRGGWSERVNTTAEPYVTALPTYSNVDSIVWLEEGLYGLDTLSRGDWVMYDIERWKWTPLNEQEHAGYYIRQFIALAHSKGLKVITAPSTNLPTPYWRALRASHSADLVDVQMEGFECFPDATLHHVQLARKYLPRYKLVLEQITPPYANCSSVKRMNRSWSAAEPYVAVRWVWTRLT